MYTKFLKIIASVTFLLSSVAGAECLITGCNNELCSDVAQGKVGVCEWQVQYQCYQQFGVCAADQDGNCAWVQTPQLQQCLENLQQKIDGDPYTPESASE